MLMERRWAESAPHLSVHASPVVAFVSVCPFGVFMHEWMHEVFVWAELEGAAAVRTRLRELVVDFSQPLSRKTGAPTSFIHSISRHIMLSPCRIPYREVQQLLTGNADD